MESIAHLYPTFAYGYNQEHQQGAQPMGSPILPTAGASDLGTSHSSPRIDGPSAVGSTTMSSDVSQQEPLQLQNSLPTAPYSPTRAELESHPIRQRLNVYGDDELDEEEESADWLELATGAEDLDLLGDQELSLSEEKEQNLGRFLGKDDMADNDIQKGDAAAYSWGGDKKGGTVTEVAKEGSVTMETARGNTVEKEAKPNDPAVRLEREGHDVVKNASELSKESGGESHNEGGVQKKVGENGQVEKKNNDGGEKKEEKKDDEKKENGDAGKKENGDAKTGEKRKAEDDASKENGEEPKKKKGRPAKDAIDGVKKEVKKRMPKKAATESGEPRRSGRNKSS